MPWGVIKGTFHSISCVSRHFMPQGDEGQRVRGGVLGLGLLVGGATFAYGYSCGCTKAEILAINDDGESPGLPEHTQPIHP